MSRTKLPSPRISKPQNFCFGCGPDNEQGMHLKFSFSKKRACVTSKVNLDARFAGPPGYCHGGIIATLLDEVMAKLNKLHGVVAVTGHLSVDYLRPIPLGQPLYMEAREVRISGRRRFREAEITNHKKEVLARGTGLFVAINPAKTFARN